MKTIKPSQVDIASGFSFVVRRSERRAIRKVLSRMKVAGWEFMHIEHKRWFGSDFHILGAKDDLARMQHEMQEFQIAYEALMNGRPGEEDYVYR